jgi:hypothetical protein
MGGAGRTGGWAAADWANAGATLGVISDATADLDNLRDCGGGTRAVRSRRCRGPAPGEFLRGLGATDGQLRRNGHQRRIGLRRE